ncbi:hypothetical protein GCM10022295_43240 [Streptomyces osmaniensis]|uniref:Uncharacterized protein n=1 Tax=Streptomyces osmaniensis TaxID=593134 RepID=A0ABP6WTM1_9ACTN
MGAGGQGAEGRGGGGDRAGGRGGRRVVRRLEQQARPVRPGIGVRSGIRTGRPAILAQGDTADR